MKAFRFAAALAITLELAIGAETFAIPLLQPEPLPPANVPKPLRPTNAAEFFALLDYSHFPVLAPVQSAVNAGNYEAAKVALLDYMRNRKAKWAAEMPTFTPPTYYYDAKNERGQLRQLQINDDLAANFDIVPVANQAMLHRFSYKDDCCWQGSDIDWSPTNATCIEPDDCDSTKTTSAFADNNSKMGWVQYVTKAYVKTNDAKYADYLVNRILLDFALDVRLEDYGWFVGPWERKAMVSRMPMLLDSYFLTLDSPSMTPQANYEILRLILEHGESFSSSIEASGAGNGDEDADAAAGAVTLGILFPEFAGGQIQPGIYEQCWTPGSARWFRGSRHWLKKGIQWLEAALIDGGKVPTLWNGLESVPPSYGESGWQSFFASNYHGGGARRLTGAFLLLDRNNTLRQLLPSDVGTTPLLSDTNVFQLSQGPLHLSLPVRARALVEVMYQNLMPNDERIPIGDGPTGTSAHILGLGVATFGDSRWKSRSSIPSWDQVGLEGRGKFEGVVANDAGYMSFRQIGSDFMMMHSDPVNRVPGTPPQSLIDSQLLFFDANDTAEPEHAHHDITQVQYFSHGHHMLIDPTGSDYEWTGWLVPPQYHNVSLPSGIQYSQAPTGTVKGDILPGAMLHSFETSRGMTVAKASLTTSPSSSNILETRTVVFFPDEYSIVVDAYPSGTSTTHATTYWHIGSRATNPSNSACTVGNGLPNAEILPDGKSVRAKFYTANSYCPAHEATLYILPLHSGETTASLLEGRTNVQTSLVYTPTKRVAYAFSPQTSPVREQVLFPQDAADAAIVPSLAALNPDDETPSRRGEKASGFDLTFGNRRDVTLISHVPSAGREFGGQFTTDANVAHVRYESGVVTKITLKDGSYLESAALGGAQLVESLDGTLEDLDIVLNGTQVELYASPSQHTVRVRAPLATQVYYNGTAHPFVQNGNYVTVDLGHSATELRIDPSDAVYAWENAVFEVDITANDSGGHIASDFTGNVTVTASPSSLEMSLDDFRTVLPNPATVPVTNGYAHLYVRGSEATISGPGSLSATYSGPYGSLTAAVKDDINIDSLETVPYVVTTTTLGASTTTTTTTTTTLPRQLVLYDGFEGFTLESSGWVNSSASPAQLWDTSSSALRPPHVLPGQTSQSVRFNNQDWITLTTSLCGYRDIQVQWSRMTKQRLAGRYLNLKWSINGPNGPWTTLESINGNDDWEVKVFSLPATVNDSPNLTLKIETVNTGTDGLGFVDELFITGNISTRH